MRNTRLILVKSVHTLIFLLVSACILYVLYCGVTGSTHWTLALALLVITAESVVYLAYGRRCPLTGLAQRYGDATGDEWFADIFLPRWFVPYLTPFCSLLFVLGLAALLINLALPRL